MEGVGLVLHLVCWICLVQSLTNTAWASRKENKQLGLVERGWDNFLYGWSVGWIKPLQAILSWYAKFQTCSLPLLRQQKQTKVGGWGGVGGGTSNYFSLWTSALHLNTLCSGKSFILEIMTANFRNITSVYSLRLWKRSISSSKILPRTNFSTIHKLLGDNF